MGDLLFILKSLRSQPIVTVQEFGSCNVREITIRMRRSAFDYTPRHRLLLVSKPLKKDSILIYLENVRSEPKAISQ